MVLEVAYIGNHAVHLLLNRNMDALPAPIPEHLARPRPAHHRLSLRPRAQSLRRTDPHYRQPQRRDRLPPDAAHAYPHFTGITLQGSNAASSYFHSLDVRVEKRYVARPLAAGQLHLLQADRPGQL